jgi:hypothetical protein
LPGRRPAHGPGDRDRARRLLDEAVEMYDGLGMPGHVALARELAAKV